MTSAALTWKDIPGHFDFGDLYTQAVATARNGAHFVEVGVLFGKSTCFMAQAIRDSRKRITFDAVDSFQWDMQTQAIQVLQVRERVSDTFWKTLTTQSSVYEAACYCLKGAGFDDLVSLIPISGQDRACVYTNGALDFVFIDAEHTYADTATLLRAYLPKLKRGGWLAGHDHTKQFPYVMQAVADVLGLVEQIGNCFLYRVP